MLIFAPVFTEAMKKGNNSILMDHNVVEFVTVAAEYCKFVETADSRTRTDFVSVALKLLPLLYLKAAVLGHMEEDEETVLETFVGEDDYEVVRIGIQAVMAEKDDYLDVFVEDMKYSDKPVLKTISEDMADIYQDLRNFVTVFRMGLESTMQASLRLAIQNFETYWGQRLVNTMRALHDVKYNQAPDDEDSEPFDLGKED